jgi:Kef-type K+ transport system membrane component KefB
MLGFADESIPFLILLFGGLLVAAMLLRAGMERLGVPPLVAFLGAGVALRVADARWGVLAADSAEVLEVLGRLGVICLLFRAGLESDLPGLLGQLRRASVLWVGNLAISAAVGFAAAYWWLDLGPAASIFVAAALTATSVGVTVAVWQDAGRLKSPTGELLVDVAELDDISGVLILAVLMAVAPELRGGVSAETFPAAAEALGWVLVKLLAFGAVCFLFSRYAERRLTGFFQRFERAPDPMLTVAGVAFILAAVAGLLGFSVAIGAFFAGLAFSRDPQAVRMEASFDAVYDLLVPFFFIGIGLAMDPSAMGGAPAAALVLVAAAVVGKILANAGPGLLLADPRAALLLGISMVPRAEIAMVIMDKGRSLGDWAVSAETFGGMVLVSAATCLGTPLVLRPLIRRWGEKGEG